MILSIGPLHLLRPLWLLALPIGVYIIWQLSKYIAKNSAWHTICDEHLLPHLLVHEKSKFKKLPLYILSAAWLLSIIALTGPSWKQELQTVYRAQTARVIALDLSESMYATDIKPSRLMRAKYKITDLLNRMPEGVTGLVAFAGEAYTVSPLTEDTNTIKAMIPELNPNIMPVQGKNISDAFRESISLLNQAGQQTGEIILMTDSTPTAADIRAARTLGEKGYQLIVYGIGTTEGAPIPTTKGKFVEDHNGAIVISKLNQTSLQHLATAANGSYVRYSTNDNDVQKILHDASVDQRYKASKERTAIWHDEGHWFIFPILLIVLLLFRKGWLDEVLH